MISQETLSKLKVWFADYVKKFHSSDFNHQQNINMKVDHTRRVCIEIIKIGKSLKLNRKYLRLAEVIALLHDVGRFEQYARYRTYADFKSEDHAKLGIKVLREKCVLKGINRSTQELILRTIVYHNQAKLPEIEDKNCLFFSRLLRDADKLDVWWVITDYYSNMNSTRNEVFEFGLPDRPEISDEACANLLARRIVKMDYVKTLNDLKLFQMGWIYDVNFLPTFRLIRDRGYMEMFRDSLPQSHKILKVYSEVRTYLEENC